MDTHRMARQPAAAADRVALNNTVEHLAAGDAQSSA